MRNKWTIAAVLLVLISGAGLYFATRKVEDNWEPLARQRLIEYLEQRFNASVDIGQLDFAHLGNTRITATGRNFRLHLNRRTDTPPFITFDELHITADLGVLYQGERTIEEVRIKGLRVMLPPRESRPKLESSNTPQQPQPFLIRRIVADGAQLTVLPSKPGKAPLEFELAQLTLTSLTPGAPLVYNTTLTIPKPPGRVTAQGHFGPWNTADPRQTPLDGVYDYRDADLGVFKGIDGTLASTGKFSGVLENISASGECRVPDFSLTLSRNPVPLKVTYRARVDGSDGDTYLEPVLATLGASSFSATGHVIGEKGKPGRDINLNVDIPNGDLKDLLRLALKGNNTFLTGRVKLSSRVHIPRGDDNVIDKLTLNGRFEIRDANFTSPTIQDKIDSLSQRGRGRPKDQSIDNVPATFRGDFAMANARLDFKPVIFVVPGALVDLNGNYDVDKAELDFHGSLNLAASMSNTFSGWKRWALKPFNPIFSKNEVGTYLPIKITGPKDNPQFGLDRKKN